MPNLLGLLRPEPRNDGSAPACFSPLTARGTAHRPGRTGRAFSISSWSVARPLLVAAAGRDLVLVAIGVQAYYLYPLAHPYPFAWLLDSSWPPVEGIFTYIAIGVTPTAALLLLLNTVMRARGLRLPLQLLTGSFAVVVGAGFLLTIVVYVLRAPQVMNWGKEALAAAVHLSLAAHGGWLLSRLDRGRLAALGACTLWVAAVAVPQHPWLVVWGDSVRDWLGP